MKTNMANKCYDSITHPPCCSSSQTLASVISLSSVKRRSLTHHTLAYRYVHRSAFLGTKLNKSKLSRTHQPITRAVTASLDAAFSDEEFSKKIRELALQFQVSHDIETKENCDWSDDMIPASIERKANSADLPFSLRIIKKKKQLNEGLIMVGESAYCSVKKAFSSMVFIIRELQSYTLQMRELLFHEDLQEIVVRVQKEMNASFVWLFQQVFSQTPTLMVYVMILLANYSVHSMSNNFAIAAAATPPATVETVTEHRSQSQFDSSPVKTFSANSGGNSNTTSIGGNNGGGGKFRAVASGTDGDGRFDGSAVFSDSILNPTRTSEESVSGQEEEWGLWNMVVDEADRKQGVVGDGYLDRETRKNFVSPVTVEIEEEDIGDYSKTELLYQTGLSQEPNNPLLLANYAQFLYLVARRGATLNRFFIRTGFKTGFGTGFEPVLYSPNQFSFRSDGPDPDSTSTAQTGFKPVFPEPVS